jgi:hypothetical protein
VACVDFLLGFLKTSLRRDKAREVKIAHASHQLIELFANRVVSR